MGLTRLEKLLYFVLVAVSNQDGVSFYSEQRLGELLEIRYPHELAGARSELVARDLIAYDGALYQVLDLPARSPRGGPVPSPSRPQHPSGSSFGSPSTTTAQEAAGGWESLRQLLRRWSREPDS